VRLIFSDEAWQDYLYWQQQDRKILQRINRLIGEIKRDPFGGIGKPEPLRLALAGYWSRRITVHDGALLIAPLRHHDSGADQPPPLRSNQSAGPNP
jgi:toxin YoeB